MYWGQGCSVDRFGSSYKSVTLLHFWTGSSEWCTECQARYSSQNISKMIWFRSVYNQTASDAWRYNNPVYKLMTDKWQLMLINVLLDQFLNIKVPQANSKYQQISMLKAWQFKTRCKGDTSNIEMSLTFECALSLYTRQMASKLLSTMCAQQINPTTYPLYRPRFELWSFHCPLQANMIRLQNYLPCI